MKFSGWRANSRLLLRVCHSWGREHSKPRLRLIDSDGAAGTSKPWQKFIPLICERNTREAFSAACRASAAKLAENTGASNRPVTTQRIIISRVRFMTFLMSAVAIASATDFKLSFVVLADVVTCAMPAGHGPKTHWFTGTDKTSSCPRANSGATSAVSKTGANIEKRHSTAFIDFRRSFIEIRRRRYPLRQRLFLGH